MKLLALLPILLSLSSALAKPHNGTSTTSQCHELARLTTLISLSQNATALALASKNNSTRASAIQAKASAAASTLATLETNSNLVTLCDQLSATEATQSSCRQLASLEKQAAKAANETTTSDALKTKVADKADTLAALQGNATLTTFCAALRTEEDCEEMTRLQKVIDRAANGTATTGGNSTRSARKLERAQAKLAELTGNATLVDACGATGVEGTNAAQAASSSSSSSSTSTSDAQSPFGPASSMLALTTLFMSAMLWL